MKTIIVVAGNFDEYRYYIGEFIMSKARTYEKRGSSVLVDESTVYVYGDNADVVRGRRNFEFVFYGTWFTRKDAEQFECLSKTLVGSVI